MIEGVLRRILSRMVEASTATDKACLSFRPRNSTLEGYRGPEEFVLPILRLRSYLFCCRNIRWNQMSAVQPTGDLAPMSYLVMNHDPMRSRSYVEDHPGIVCPCLDQVPGQHHVAPSSTLYFLVKRGQSLQNPVAGKFAKI